MTSSAQFESIKPHLLPIITLLVVIATVPLVILPWISQGMEDYEALNDKNELVVTLTAKADKLDALDVSSTRALLQDTVQPALPAEADPAGVLGTVELLARQAEVAVVAVDYANNPNAKKKRSSSSSSSSSGSQENSNEAAAPVVSATITLKGGYENIASFIRRSESALRVFNLDSAHLSQIDQTTSDVTASFKISAPYLPHPEDLGAVESPLPELTAAETKIIDRINKYNAANFAPTEVQSISGRSNPF